MNYVDTFLQVVATIAVYELGKWMGREIRRHWLSKSTKDEEISAEQWMDGTRDTLWLSLCRVLARRGEFTFTFAQLAYELGEVCHFADERRALRSRIEAFDGWSFSIPNGNRYVFTATDGPEGRVYRAKLAPIESEVQP